MNIIQIIQIIMAGACLVVLLYVVFVAQPETNKLLQECSEEVLCAEGLLTGQVCAGFEPQPIFDPQQMPFIE